jgi:hypothetical protein
MALNFGLLNTNLPGEIAGSVQRGQDEALRNQMAQQQLKTGALQQESAQMQLEQAKREREALANMQAKFVANGKSPDMRANFQEMVQSGIPHFMDIGIKGMQALDRQANITKILSGGAPSGMPAAEAPVGAPAAPVPSVVRQPAPMPSQNALGTGTYGMESGAPVNALAAPAANAYKPTVPRNALALPQSEQAALENEYRVIEQLHIAGEHELAKSREQRLKLKSETTSPLNKLIVERNALPEGDPMRKIYDARILKEATHAPPVSVSMTQEKAESADYGKFLVDQFKNVSKASDLAMKSMPAIESNLNILDKGFDTGFGTETVAAGAKVLGALGVKDAEKFATNSQTFLANANAAVLQKQLEQKGPQTEADAQRISATGAQLGNTKDANKFVLNVAKAQLQRDIDQRNFYADWRKNNKTLDGAEDAWNAGPGSKSLFENPALKKYTAPIKTNANATPTAPRLSLDAIFTPK